MISTATSWASGWSRSCGSSAVSYLPVEHARDRLVAIILRIGLRPVHPEGPHHRRVLDREQDGVPTTGAGVLVPGPRRHHEHVTLVPVEALAVDDGVTGALEGQIDRAAGVAVRRGPHTGTDELDPAGERRHDRSAGVWVDVLHRHVVVRAGGDGSEPAQRLLGPRPLVIEQRRERARRSLPGRTELTEAVPALG